MIKPLCLKTKEEVKFKNKYEHGYCIYSLDFQPPGSKIGTYDPSCSRFCPYKAPVDVARMYNFYLRTKGIEKASMYTLNHREKIIELSDRIDRVNYKLKNVVS